MEEAKMENKTEAPRQVIEINERGLIAPKTTAELATLAKGLLAGKALPSWFKNTAEVISAWNLLASMDIPPQPNLKNVCWINDSPYIYGELPKLLAERTGDLEICRTFVSDEEYKRISFENKNLSAKPFAGVCQIKRKGRDEQSYHFTVEQARKAGLWEKKSKTGAPSPWVLYPEIMLMRRAQALALKMEFSDALGGVGIAEYDQHEAPDLKDVTPNNGKLDALNALVRKSKPEAVNGNIDSAGPDRM